VNSYHARVSHNSPMSNRIRSVATYSALSAMLSLSLAAAGAHRVEARPAATPGVGASARGDSTPGITSPITRIADALRGLSGSLFARFVSPGLTTPAVPAFAAIFGDSSLSRPGMYPVAPLTRPFAFITMHPFAEKHGMNLGAYRLGFWPAEKHAVRSPAYANPNGFIEVTQANMDTPVSEHFKLGDFLTHDQPNVWPKYLVLQQKLIDKLELVLSDLQAHGVDTRGVRVMSGFRTPQYNVGGGNTGGRASLSRHMYGDAADIFIDNDHDGQMDDLNHDGRISIDDARVIQAAVDRVEAAHPELVGGAGVYTAAPGHGPFIHIDTRGYRARWMGTSGG